MEEEKGKNLQPTHRVIRHSLCLVHVRSDHLAGLPSRLAKHQTADLLIDVGRDELALSRPPFAVGGEEVGSKHAHDDVSNVGVWEILGPSEHLAHQARVDGVQLDGAGGDEDEGRAVFLEDAALFSPFEPVRRAVDPLVEVPGEDPFVQRVQRYTARHPKWVVVVDGADEDWETRLSCHEVVSHKAVDIGQCPQAK